MINNKEKNFVSAVIYCRNNEKQVKTAIDTVSGVLSENFNNYEIICVDDGSKDNTAEIIKSCAPKDDSCVLSLIRMSHYQGTEAAMSAGVNLCIGDYVFEFDSCVFNFSSDLIMKVYKKALQGFDIVAAVDKNYRKASSRLFYSLFNKGANIGTPIKSEAFRIVSRRAINRICSFGKFVKYRKALYANSGLKSADVFYLGDKSKALSEADVSYRTESAISFLILFTNLAYRLSVVFSLLMMAATLGIGIYTIVVFLTSNVVEGFATTMLVMSGSFFAVFLLFAIVIKYLSVLVQLVFNEKEYMIESIEKITG